MELTLYVEPIRSEKLKKKIKLIIRTETDNEQIIHKILKDCKSLSLLKNITSEYSDCALKNCKKHCIFRWKSILASNAFRRGTWRRRRQNR